MKIIKKTTIGEPADKVWKVFAHDFDSAGEWMSSVPNTYGKNLGKKFEGAKSSGRVCELDGGISVSEPILAYDEVNKTLTLETFFSNAPPLVPILGNVVNFSVKDSGKNQSVVTWIIKPKLKPFAYLLYPLVKFGLGLFIGQIIGELKYFVENGKPHPRKLKAISKLQLATNG